MSGEAPDASSPGQRTALVVAGPDLPPDLEALRREHDPAAAAGIPPHVTVMFPFLPQDEVGTNIGDLANVVEGIDPFDYQLTRLRDLRGGVAVLEAHPRERFLDLTRKVIRRWPHLRPYGGTVALDEVVPHLTLGHNLPPDVRNWLDTRLDSELPIAARAEGISLLVERDGWHVETVFDLS